jgi:hypothetical protein
MRVTADTVAFAPSHALDRDRGKHAQAPSFNDADACPPVATPGAAGRRIVRVPSLR